MMPLPVQQVDQQQMQVPYINFQSIGPNGRPSITYSSPNFGFYVRNRELMNSDDDRTMNQADEAAAGSSSSSSNIQFLPWMIYLSI